MPLQIVHFRLEVAGDINASQQNIRRYDEQIMHVPETHQHH